jgi:hypothetical protein
LVIIDVLTTWSRFGGFYTEQALLHLPWLENAFSFSSKQYFFTSEIEAGFDSAPRDIVTM